MLIFIITHPFSQSYIYSLWGRLSLSAWLLGALGLHEILAPELAWAWIIWMTQAVGTREALA